MFAFPTSTIFNQETGKENVVLFRHHCGHFKLVLRGEKMWLEQEEITSQAEWDLEEMRKGR